MKKTLINNKWELLLPDHRAARPEWPVWEKERLQSIHDCIREVRYVWDIQEGQKVKLKQTKRPVIFDVGAEEGDFPALFSSWGADVVLFEPNPKVWPNIKAIWEANELKHPLGNWVGFASSIDSFPNVIFVKDGNGRFVFEGFPSCADGELIGDHGFKELVDAGEIPQIKLDTFSELSKITPDIITVDVEGSEFEVLKGAEAILRLKKPIVYVSIHPEFMFRHFGQYTAELVKYMTDLGYTYEILAFDHEFHFLFKPKL